jgi:hypothetical protein
LKNLKKALINQLRTRLTDPGARGTATSDSFNGTGAALTFTLTNKPLMCVTSVTVGGVSQKLNSDYFIDFGTSADYAIITFASAPGVGTNNVVVSYKHGVNWVYDDQPHAEAQMPRISVLNVGGEGEISGGVGDQIVILAPVFRIGAWVKGGDTYTISGEKYSGSKLLDFLVTNLQDTIRAIRLNQDIAFLIDLQCGEPTYLGLDEEYKIKRCEILVKARYQKNY